MSVKTGVATAARNTAAVAKTLESRSSTMPFARTLFAMMVLPGALICNSLLLRASTYCQMCLALAPSSDHLSRLLAASRLFMTVCSQMPTTKGAGRLALDIGLAPLRELLTEHIRARPNSGLGLVLWGNGGRVKGSQRSRVERHPAAREAAPDRRRGICTAAARQQAAGRCYGVALTCTSSPSSIGS